MECRHYQEDGVTSFFRYFETSTGNPVGAFPTGSGKSLIIAEFLRRALILFPDTRAMMLTHVKELIQQNYNEFVELWPMAPVGIYSAGLKRKELRPITFAGIATVAKCWELFGFIHLLVVDECHMIPPRDEAIYQSFIANLMRVNPKLKVIGLTATPFRNGQGLLTNPIVTKQGPKQSIFTDICCNWTTFEKFNQLIAEGYLCKLVAKRRTTEIDVSNVRTDRGDFNIDELQLAADRAEITRKAIDETVAEVEASPHSNGQPRLKWLVFVTGIDHSDHVAEELNSRGISARSVHSESKDDWRSKAVDWFKEEGHPEIRALVNNGVFTTGFNVKPLDVMIILRPTNSAALWVQMLGRGTRPFPGKDNCLVLDFAGNTKRLGPINDPKIPLGKGKRAGGDSPIKVCPKCNAYNHTSARFCEHCNEEFKTSVRFGEHASTLELVKESEQPIEPVIVEHAVQHVEYFEQPSRARPPRPPSFRVVYTCGPIQVFWEYLSFEHGGFASKHARDWWRRATKQAELQQPPNTVKEAVQRAGSLRAPKFIRVWMNGKCKVMDHDYDGTGTGWLYDRKKLVAATIEETKV